MTGVFRLAEGQGVGRERAANGLSRSGGLYEEGAEEGMRLRVAGRGVSAAVALAAVAGLAGPALAGPHIHFYTFEVPGNSGRAKVIDVVKGAATANQHQIGECKNIRIGRDFFNESGRIVQLFRSANCRGLPAHELENGEQVTNSNGFQSVLVVKDT